ncbi:MAG: FAD-dependent thymidylate synthase [Holosporales bacterium]|jgi:thymidylate synthase ThyX|nr:FAD-dependent thymidylate synthase [Holosporales bacterium]
MPELFSPKSNVVEEDYKAKYAEYISLVGSGVPREVARTALPLSQLTQFTVTLSLQDIKKILELGRIIPSMRSQLLQVYDALSSSNEANQFVTRRRNVPAMEKLIDRSLKPTDMDGNVISNWEVVLKDYSGDMRTVYDAARQSHGVSDGEQASLKEILNLNMRLIKMRHITPFGMPHVNLMMIAPFQVARQLGRARYARYFRLEFLPDQCYVPIAKRQVGDDVRVRTMQEVINQSMRYVRDVTETSLQIAQNLGDGTLDIRPYLLTQGTLVKVSCQMDMFNLIRTTHMRTAKAAQLEIRYLFKPIEDIMFPAWGISQIYDQYKKYTKSY